MRGQHLYIEQADQVMIEFILKEIDERSAKELVEFGCGPGGILQNVVGRRDVRFTAVDHDPSFLEHMQSLVPKGSAEFQVADVTQYQHSCVVDVFYSHGMHHHIEKGERVRTYLANIYSQLSPQGRYLLTDEFLAEYQGEDKRKIQTVVWHSHIIAHAVRNDFGTLAVEEAKTLIDDLYEQTDRESYKTPAQVATVLEAVVSIDDACFSKNMREAKVIAGKLLCCLESLGSTKKQGDDRYDLSRGDYKVSPSVVENELRSAGFVVEKKVALGPIDTMGGIIIYAFKKA